MIGVALIGAGVLAGTLHAKNALLPIGNDLLTDSKFAATLAGIGIWLVLANALPDSAVLGLSALIILGGVGTITT